MADGGNPGPGEFPTILGPDANFKGELSFEKGMRLMGINTTQQLLVVGVVMLAAVYYHRSRRRIAVRLRNEGY